MYEWETKVEANQIEIRKHWLRSEIKRISTVTLRQEFIKKEDKEYWCSRLKKLNSELSALEEMR